MVALAVLGAGCKDSSESPPGGQAPLPAASPTPSPFAASLPTGWPAYRGDPLCRGVAGGTLPSRLELRWSYKTGGPIQSSAVVDQGRVFFGSDDHQVYALDWKTGEKLWSFQTQGGVEASPLVHNGVVYIGSADTHLYALDAARGEQLWKFTTAEKILAAAALVAPDAKSTSTPPADAELLVGSYDAKLYCLSARTGAPRWQYETENYINGSAAVAGDLAIFGGCDKRIHVVDLKTGVARRTVDLEAPVANTVAVYDGKAYVGHYGNRFVCIDLASGKIDWTYRHKEFAFFSSPAVTADCVVFGARDKRVHCVNRADGARRWMFATQGAVDSSPVLCDGKVVVGSGDGRLYLLNLADGRELFSYEIGAEITASPAVAEGMVFIGAEDGCLYAFGPAITPAAAAPPAAARE